MSTPVIFRMWLDRPSGCIAFLPTVKPKKPWYITSFELECGERDASLGLCKENTRPATRAERKKVEQALREKYGELQILQHFPRRKGDDG